MKYLSAVLAAALAAIPALASAQPAPAPAEPAPAPKGLPATPVLPGDPGAGAPLPVPSGSVADDRPVPSPRLAPEPEPPEPEDDGPPLRFSVGGGGSVLILGSEGERWRGLFELDVYPGGRFGRYGVTLAARSILFDPFGEAGLVTAGVIFEAAAARPRLALALHGDVGVTYGPDGGDDVRPAVGGGLKSHLGIIGPLAIATDVTAHVVLGDTDDLALVIGMGAMITLFR
jgi:hypothetical protein